MIDAFLTTLPSWLLFIIIVCIPTVLAWASTLFVHRRMKEPLDDTHNEVAGFIYAAVSVLFAVLLAFVVFIGWEQFHTADQAVSGEAAALIAVAHDSTLLPEPARQEVHDLLRQYAEIVVNNEWQSADINSLDGNPRALSVINQIWTIYRQQPLGTVNTQMQTSLDNLSIQRAQRLLSNQAALPDVFLVVLVIGALITIYFSLILRMKNARQHAIMTALLTAIIFVSLWLIVAIDHPFVGDFRVPPDAFVHAVNVIDSLPR